MNNQNFIPSNISQNSNIESKLSSLLSIMKELSKVIEKENNAIVNHDFATIKSLQEDKRKLTHAYGESFKAVSVFGEKIKSFDEGKKKVIETVSRNLSKVMEENSLLLKSGIYASRKLIDTIVKSAEDEEQEAKGFYSKSGKLGNENRYRSALSVNQVL